MRPNGRTSPSPSVATEAGMTRLKNRIIDLIGAVGPIPVNEYMALCLFDPEDGYYTTRDRNHIR